MSVIKTLPKKIRWRTLTSWSRLRFPPIDRDDIELIGSVYGRWPVLLDCLDADSICYCAGVGEDATFDLGLIERVGCDVHAFDPTPRAIEYVKSIAAENEKFHFHPWGVWSRNETMKFYAPAKAHHVSHSILNLRDQSDYFEAPCRSIQSIMEDLGHDRIDLLKLDIEGAEYEAAGAMLDAGIFPTLLCLEFDQPYPYRKTMQFVRQRILPHYCVYHVEHWNFSFVHRSAVMPEVVVLAGRS